MLNGAMGQLHEISAYPEVLKYQFQGCQDGSVNNNSYC